MTTIFLKKFIISAKSKLRKFSRFQHSIDMPRIRDLLAGYLGEVCRNVSTEPSLLPATRQEVSGEVANHAQNASLDIKAHGMLNAGQEAYFEVRIFYPCVSSHIQKSMKALYHRHQQAKKSQYAEQAREAEHGAIVTERACSQGQYLCEASCGSAH